MDNLFFFFFLNLVVYAHEKMEQNPLTFLDKEWGYVKR